MSEVQLGAEEQIDELEATARVRRVPHQGRIVHWRGWGEGPTLVLLHGGHGSWLHWVRNIAALARQYTVWVPDLPGFGDSDALAQASDYEALVLALSATMEAVLGEEASIGLVGFSFGALVAAELAARCPRVRRLALIGPAGHGGARRQTLEMINWRKATHAEEQRAAWRNNLASLMLFSPASIDELALRVQARSSQATRFLSKPISRSAQLVQVLERLHVPILLLWGAHDVTAVPQAIAPLLEAGHPERQSRIVPGAGHWVQYEAATLCNSQLGHWFSHD